jgi:hypothetical protein
MGGGVGAPRARPSQDGDRLVRPARIPYKEAGEAGRATLRRANGLQLSVNDRRVLDAVLAFTVLYSRLEHSIYLAQLAAFSFGVDEAKPWMLKRTREALLRLAAHELVRSTPPRGRPGVASGRPSYLIGLYPAPTTDPGSKVSERGWTTPETDPGSKVSNTAGNGPRSGHETDPAERRNGPGSSTETDPTPRGPTEKTSEKTSEERARGPVDIAAGISTRPTDPLERQQEASVAVTPARRAHGDTSVTEALLQLEANAYRYGYPREIVPDLNALLPPSAAPTSGGSTPANPWVDVVDGVAVRRGSS